MEIDENDPLIKYIDDMLDLFDEISEKGIRLSQELYTYKKMQSGFGEPLLSILPDNLFIFIQALIPNEDTEISEEDLQDSEYPEVWEAGFGEAIQAGKESKDRQFFRVIIDFRDCIYPLEPPMIKFVGKIPKLDYVDEDGEIIPKKFKVFAHWKDKEFWRNSFIQLILLIMALDIKGKAKEI